MGVFLPEVRFIKLRRLKFKRMRNERRGLFGVVHGLIMSE